MKLQSVVISFQARQKLREIVADAWLVETGGPLVGYLSAAGVLLVTDLAGPGPLGVRLPFSVKIDGRHSQEFCDSVFEASGGMCDYVGDWHCHPSFSITPSDGDVAAMKLMAGIPGLVKNPLSIIYSKFSRRMKAYEWDRNHERLVMVPLSYSSERG